MSTFLDAVQHQVEKACSRDTIAQAYYGGNSNFYAEAEENCRVAVRTMKLIVCENMGPLDKIPVVALRHSQMSDFRNRIAHNCELFDDPDKFCGIHKEHFVVIGQLANPYTYSERVFREKMLARLHGRTTRVWCIEDWR